MNDSHPSGNSFPADTSHGFSYAASGAGQYEQAAFGSYAQQGHGQPSSYEDYPSGSFGNHGFSSDDDPLYGSMAGPGTGNDGAWMPGTYDAYSGHGAYDTGSYDTGTYNTGSYDTGGYDPNEAWTNAGFQHTAEVHAQPGTGQADFDSGWSSGQWDASQWEGQWEPGGEWSSADNNSGWDAYGYDQTPAGSPEGAATGSFEAYDSFDAQESYEAYEPGATGSYGTQDQQQPSYEDAAFTHGAEADATTAFPAFDGAYQNYDAYDGYDAYGTDSAYDTDALAHVGEPGGQHDDLHGHAAESREDAAAPHVRPEQDLRVANLPGRRRSPRPRRSALLTVAVPSVAVMGVAGAAAASVAGNAQQDDTTTQASADVPVKPVNKKLDTQLAGLSADADDFADRASRAQERRDLQARQEAERKRKAREAARKEALRPKFALPVKEHGLSATYGQAGLNWMSVHTGIDFPVSEGTPVMAATDGTVTTKYDVSFGNMAVVTAPDGTETWYCHLSSTKIRSGQVKAGDTIGYSGTSGNSTGPHLHFEVHPGGGDAIDPLPWLRGKGLNPQ
ncbi:M23 family metallopeptidase [Streptomyces sp. WMMB 322]|uniref:M23 family metallopeptidase n=1 Tax=Streptomyces sp. WMMB 322 TaxID=1286821 RepID=UPI0020C77060|nr:peptidoglycan DD-metalloendopeptidase family protein [Streptomyces sp. WMMB 322]